MASDTKSDLSTDDDSDMQSDNNNQQYIPLKDMPTNKKCCSRQSIIAQTLVTGAVMLSAASCGMPIGYSAILLPQLKETNGSMRIDDDVGSWIASIHSAATPFGSLLSGLLMDRCGRKLALQIASIPLIIGWILIALSQSHVVLLTGRLVAGLSAGLTAAAGQVLIGEVSEPHLRGILMSVPFASYSFGILLVYALGYLLAWRYVAGVSTILPVLSILVFFFLPESPVWLVRRGETEKAKQALTWLRGGNAQQAKEETKHLMHRIEMEKDESQSKATWRSFLEPQVFKPFIIINVFNILQIFSGTYLIVFYAVDIIRQIDSEIDSFLSAVLTACVRFIFTLISSVLLGLIGRRSLALSSGVGTALSSLCLGTFIYLQINCSPNGYFTALCILAYVATNTVGFMILPGVMLGELYPAKVRGLAGGLTFMVFNLVLFLTAKAFPLVKDAVGIHGIFWIFGGSSVLASLFLYLLLPETKGKSLSQIEDYFMQKNVMWITRLKEDKCIKSLKETEAIIA